MVFSVWKARILLSSPWCNTWLVFSIGRRRLYAPREQSRADLPSFYIKTFSAPEWHLRGQWSFSDSYHLQSGSVQTPCPRLLSLWKGGEWSTLFTHVCTFAFSTLLVSPSNLLRPRCSQKVDSELFQQMSESLLCARHCVGVSKAKWKWIRYRSKK